MMLWFTAFKTSTVAKFSAGAAAVGVVLADITESWQVRWGTLGMLVIAVIDIMRRARNEWRMRREREVLKAKEAGRKELLDEQAASAEKLKIDALDLQTTELKRTIAAAQLEYRSCMDLHESKDQERHAESTDGIKKTNEALGKLAQSVEAVTEKLNQGSWHGKSVEPGNG